MQLFKEYNVSLEDSVSLSGWGDILPSPALFLSIPSARDVGERELMAELARKVYVSLGFRDSLSRHVLVRSFPCAGSKEEYLRFEDAPMRVAEISNVFSGTDFVDLSEWAGVAADEYVLGKLAAHVRSGTFEGRVSYVFFAYADSEHDTKKLSDYISSHTGLGILHVRLRYPTAHALATRLKRELKSMDDASLEPVESWIEKTQDLFGNAFNYSRVKALANMVDFEVLNETGASSLVDALEMCAKRIVPQDARCRVGFC